MRLARFDVDLRGLENAPVHLSEGGRPVVFRVLDADPVVAVAGACVDWLGPWGLWLRASEDYSAGLIARDVKTLSHLLELDHVVVEADRDAHLHAEVVAALLSGERVTLHNAVATITNAYNRPAPPRTITVWSAQDEVLRHDSSVLQARASSGALTYFSD